MTLHHRTDIFDARDGEFSAVTFASARDIASIRTASDAIISISIIIRQAAR